MRQLQFAIWYIMIIIQNHALYKAGLRVCVKLYVHMREYSERDIVISWPTGHEFCETVGVCAVSTLAQFPFPTSALFYITPTINFAKTTYLMLYSIYRWKPTDRLMKLRQFEYFRFCLRAWNLWTILSTIYSRVY